MGSCGHPLCAVWIPIGGVPLKTNTKKDEVMWSKSYQQDRHIWGSHRMHAETTLQCGHRSAKRRQRHLLHRVPHPGELSSLEVFPPNVTLTNVSRREHVCFTKKADAETSPDRKKVLV
jgi:hypothetical protein